MHDLGGWLIGACRSVKIRGPLWRRSAFRSAKSGWRDFALRGRRRELGQVAPNEFAKADLGFLRELTKGEG
jgi:hypothetical protein